MLAFSFGQKSRLFDFATGYGIARLPLFFAACFAPFFPNFSNAAVHLSVAALVGILFVSLPAAIWSLVLLFQSFKTASGLRTGKLWAAFLVALLLAEGASKVAIAMFNSPSHHNFKSVDGAIVEPTPFSFDTGAASASPSIPFALGAATFAPGDSIRIDEIDSSDTPMKVGGTYLVKGHYVLQSHDNASLLFSVTTSAHSGQSAIAPGSEAFISKGEGTFALSKRFDDLGYPHISFYSEDGNMFGGVYFGDGEWLLREK